MLFALKNTLIFITVLLFTTPLVSSVASAKGVFQSRADFIGEVFPNQPPQSKVLWITPELRQQAQKILGHPLYGLRIRYHRTDHKTAWILEEIGKEMPITMGVVVENHKVALVKILAYRESRGGEVRYRAYTNQYIGMGLDSNLRLNQSVDGITGATLSVWAVNKVVNLALYYHSLVISQTDH
ncbi:MAG: FMN-binding protein [Porticoccaceae bacterium]|nr:FMN-binding protein [Porticoccaceae bacterium]